MHRPVKKLQNYLCNGVLENRPLAFVNIVAFLVLEVLAGLEIDGVAQVFPLFQDVHNGG